MDAFRYDLEIHMAQNEELSERGRERRTTMMFCSLVLGFVPAIFVGIVAVKFGFAGSLFVSYQMIGALIQSRKTLLRLAYASIIFLLFSTFLVYLIFKVLPVLFRIPEYRVE